VSLSEITRESIDDAMSVALEMGRKPFLESNGFGYATNYLLLQDGRLFDPKAIVGVAHGRVPGREPLQPGDFDATEAIRRLRQLGYTVVEFSGLWWVNQGATYDEERAGGYVWAPQTNKVGNQVPHHVAVNQLRVGQKIVHYAAGQIRAIGTVAEPPETHPKPKELGTAWGESGYLCRVLYHDLEPAIAKADVPNRTSAVGPFDVNGNIKQAYLVKVSDAELFPLLEFLYARDPQLFEPADPASLPDLPTLATPAEESVAHPLVQLLVSAKNIVLEGVPGTGKTFAIEEIAKGWEGVTGRPLLRVRDQLFAATVMHPSTSYEDFIEGLRPTLGDDPSTQSVYFDEPVSGRGKFRLEDGFFLRACRMAAQNPNADLLVLLDELNRCNVPSVLGDLLLSIEASKRAQFVGSDPHRATAADWEAPVGITLPYSRRLFFVPSNVYVIATTNTTDRSVAPLDAAIRRRFSFVRLEPDFEALRVQAQQLNSDARELFDDSLALMETLNDTVLGVCIGPDAMLGQSYLYGMHARLRGHATGNGMATAREIWEFQILPQLIESVRAHGAEDLLDATARGHWLSDHQLDTVLVTASSALDALDDFLGRLGLALVVDGTGLARGARVVTAWPPATGPADLVYPDVELNLTDLETEDAPAEVTR
jgi:MoxR-like ATPase